MSELRAIEIYRAVYERFEGLAPTSGNEIDLSAIIFAVLEELERRNMIDLELAEEVSG